MAANAGIYQQYLNPVRSVADYRGDMDKQEQNALTLAAGRLTNQQAQQAVTDDQATRQAFMDSGGDSAKTLNALQAAGLYKPARELQKSQLDTQKTQSEVGLNNAHAGNFKQQTDASANDLREKKRHQAISDIAAFTSPEQAVASLKAHAAAGDVPPDQAEMILQGIPQNPADFPKWQIGMLQRIMSAKEAAGQIAPDANTVATNDRIKTEGRLNRETQIKVQGMIADRQDARGDVEPTLAPETRARIAKQFLKGDKSGLQNLGRGAQGAANLVAIQNDITAEATRQGMSGEAIAARMAEYGGLVAGMRTSGTISARIENAAAEAVELVPLALAASQNVVRSGFLPFGKAGVMFDTQSNSPAMAEFATANLGLATAYASAMARGNKPTVSDMEHSRELLSTAKNQAAYEATVRQMQREIAAAQRAPKSVREGLSNEIAGKGGHAAPAAAATDIHAQADAILRGGK